VVQWVRLFPALLCFPLLQFAGARHTAAANFSGYGRAQLLSLCASQTRVLGCRMHTYVHPTTAAAWPLPADVHRVLQSAGMRATSSSAASRASCAAPARRASTSAPPPSRSPSTSSACARRTGPPSAWCAAVNCEHGKRFLLNMCCGGHHLALSHGAVVFWVYIQRGCSAVAYDARQACKEVSTPCDGAVRAACGRCPTRSSAASPRSGRCMPLATSAPTPPAATGSWTTSSTRCAFREASFGSEAPFGTGLLKGPGAHLVQHQSPVTGTTHARSVSSFAAAQSPAQQCISMHECLTAGTC
jgi:hypothetical protein